MRRAWLVVAALATACRRDAAQPDVDASRAAARPKLVSPLPSAVPPVSASSHARGIAPLVARSAPGADKEHAAWDILAGRRPAGELPVESYDPNLRIAPMGERDPSGPPLQIVEVSLDLSPGLPLEEFKRRAPRRAQRFQSCFEEALHDDPWLEGDVAVSSDVERHGGADNVKAVGRSAATAQLAACVARAATAGFPPGHEGHAEAVYSFKRGPVQ